MFTYDITILDILSELYEGYMCRLQTMYYDDVQPA